MKVLAVFGKRADDGKRTGIFFKRQNLRSHYINLVQKTHNSKTSAKVLVFFNSYEFTRR
jgi:hypothetical protein